MKSNAPVQGRAAGHIQKPTTCRSGKAAPTQTAALQGVLVNRQRWGASAWPEWSVASSPTFVLSIRLRFVSFEQSPNTFLFDDKIPHKSPISPNRKIQMHDYFLFIIEQFSISNQVIFFKRQNGVNLVKHVTKDN